MSIKQKIIISIGGITVVSFVIIAIVTMMQFDSVNYNYEMKYAQSISSSIETNRATEMKKTVVAVNSIANNQQIQTLFYRRDREGLFKLLSPIYESIKGDVAQFQFHLPDSTSFLRMHQPKKFGDSLASFRETVNYTNKSKQAAMGIEEGVAGYGLRVVVPVLYNGEHIGSVEYGNDFGNKYVQSVKKEYSAECFLYRYPAITETDKIKNMLAGTQSADKIVVEESAIAKISAGKPIYEITKDKQYGVLLIPNRDFKNQITSYTKVIFDRSDIIAANNSAFTKLALILFVSLLVLILALWVSISYSLRYVKTLVEATKVVARGDYTHELNIDTKDEMGILAEEFSIMQNQTKAMIGEIHSTSAQLFEQNANLETVARDLKASSKDVYGIATEISQGAHRQAQEAEQTQVKTAELSNSIMIIQNFVKETCDKAAVMSENAEEGSKTTTELATALHDNLLQANMLAEIMAQLTAKSNDIAEISNTISGIAKQTNLLALNAAIEAARAGEFGSGFSVVAQEIRILAEQSSNSTAEIKSIINHISLLIAEANIAVKANKDKINFSMEGVTLSNTVYCELVKSVHGVSEAVSNIMKELSIIIALKNETLAATEKISDITDESARASESVKELVKANNKSIEELAEILDDVNSVIKKLNSVVGRFKI